MKLVHLQKALLLPAVLLSLSLTACVEPLYTNGTGYGGYGSYSTLPRNYSGNAYQHNGRYYSGGQYQNGNYNYQGRNYDSRYYHNGQYYYGGNHRAYGNSIPVQNGRYPGY
ncbi:MAG: hypothetical protein B7Z37_06745 [Verrucomicrobia bacterium 12-59-8]|nr:MAG: hypothetical protein B7Z37_06745 [Verrucomicrobia bacterium 12-59-8]